MKNKLQLMDTEVHPNFQIQEKYLYEYTSLDDTVNLMLYLQREYGVIDDVYLYKTENDAILYSREYDSIEEFASKALKEIDDNFGIVMLECRDRWIDFRLEYDTNSVWVNNSEPYKGERSHDPDKIMYYCDMTFGGIIKYDKNDGSLFSFDPRENKWKHDRSLRYFFFSHDDYDYELIENYKDPVDNP